MTDVTTKRKRGRASREARKSPKRDWSAEAKACADLLGPLPPAEVRRIEGCMGVMRALTWADLSPQWLDGGTP
jgi:hypothetical protein